MAKNTVDPTIMSMINKYLQRVREFGIPVEKAILFGSHAKGAAHKYSDVDLCVVSDQFGKDSHQELLTLLKLTDKETVDIEPHPYSPKDLENKWDPLAAEIVNFGIVI
jgi:predicted nucleotidyltransferase